VESRLAAFEASWQIDATLSESAMMLFETMLLLTAHAAPTVAMIKRLSPRAAGDITLVGKVHNPIAEVVFPGVRGIPPPGLVDVEMVERTMFVAGGCLRKRWKVSFSGSPSAPSDATLSYAYAVTEVALRRSARCPRDGYVNISGGIEPAQAFAGLTYLDDIRSHRRKANFSCSDSTSSGFCVNPRILRQDLAKIRPWAIKQERDVTTIWMGEFKQGYMQVVTEVTYSVSDPANVTVSRRIPAPF